MDVLRFVAELRKDPDLASELVHHEVMPGQEAEHGAWSELPAPLLAALTARGAGRPWRHQAEAVALVDAGRDVAVVTPTASGKSLIYAVPILARALREPGARALLVFPLKALEQDQQRMLAGLAEAAGLPEGAVAIMDGDTTPTARKRLKARPPTVLITTPDMLHFGLLPFHAAWEELFRTLRYVVLDELHTYRGVFGSHVAQVLRRLARVAASYGAAPQWLACSATIANPAEFAGKLVGRPFEVVSRTSAPRAARHVVFVNPAASTATRAAQLFARCLDRGLRTIVFTKARKLTELIYQWVGESRRDLAGRVSAYRSGYLPEERREIEEQLSSGRLLGVVSTSALEMGIDIGGLDVCVLVGYPGTVASTWQRGGRVGRGVDESLILMLGGPDALDQYFMHHPEDFFRRGAEAAVVDPDNEPILSAHLPCAAAELPLREDDPWLTPSKRLALIEKLEGQGELLRAATGERRWFSGRRQPHRFVDLRDTGEGFSILLAPEEGEHASKHASEASVDLDPEDGGKLEDRDDREDKKDRRAVRRDRSGRSVGSISFGRALKECHEGAVYLHRGRTYVVTRLDLERRNVFVAPSRARYYTNVATEKETTILEQQLARPLGNALLKYGRVRVEERVVGFEKRRTRTGEKMSVHPLDLPPQIYETTGLWFEIDPFVLDCVRRGAGSPMGGMHALEHGSIALFPLFVYCDRFDIGGICYPAHPQLRKGAIFVYDGYPGGVGLARKGYDLMEDLLRAVVKLVQECPCEAGCPSCIHSPKCGSGNKPLDKAGAVLLARLLLGEVNPEAVAAGASSQADDDEDDGPGAPPEVPAEPSGPRVLYFDLETQRSADEVGGWGNSHLMKVSVACVWDERDQRMREYGERDVPALVEDLKAADLVVGFNVKRFDYRVLAGYTTFDFGAVPTFDMLDAVKAILGYRLSLGHLGEKTLGRPKTADGLQSLQWVKEGRLDLVAKYCRADVELTRDLFLHGLREGFFLYEREGAGLVRLPLKWELPAILERAAAEAASRRGAAPAAAGARRFGSRPGGR